MGGIGEAGFGGKGPVAEAAGKRGEMWMGEEVTKEGNEYLLVSPS